MLSSGRDLTPSSPRIRLCSKEPGLQAALSQLPPLQAEPSCGAGLPARQLCHLCLTWLQPCPKAPMGPILEAPGLWSSGVRGTSCLLSLPWSSLLSEWCCLRSPHRGASLSVFIVVFIYIYESTWPGPHAQPAPRLIYLLLKSSCSDSALSLIKCGGLSPP